MSNLTASLDRKQTANKLMLKVLDQIYVVSPLQPSPSPITERINVPFVTQEHCAVSVKSGTGLVTRFAGRGTRFIVDGRGRASLARVSQRRELMRDGERSVSI